MKRAFTVMSILSLGLGFSACSNDANKTGTTTESSSTATESKGQSDRKSVV